MTADLPTFAPGWKVRTLDRKIACQHRSTKADAIALRAILAGR